MREFAHATVKEVEDHFKVDRAEWKVDGILDTSFIRFFLEESTDMSDKFLYHAMCDIDGELGDEPVLYGDPAEIPREWLDAEKIQFYFKVSADEFSKPGFLKNYFKDL